ncbi:hypothetical protein IWW45_007213 [Coemansia sp. RSA 485]|nr:hypothetical protein IWW45_007213 [Coemansia sp. RSA 485]
MQHMPLQIMDDAKDGISCVAMTDTEVIAGSIDGSVRTYDIRAGKQVTDTMGQPVVSLRIFSSDFLQKSVMAVACMDSTVQLIDRSNVSVMGTFAGHLCENYRIQCDTNGRMVASGSEDGYVYVWNCLESSMDYNDCAKHMSRLAGHSGIVNAVAFHPHSAFDSKPSCASLCHSAFWGSKLRNKYLVEVTMTTSLKHRTQHLYYETALPKPYRIVHQEEDGDDAEDADDMSWVNRGHEEKAKRMIRLKITVDDVNQVQEVECG